MDGKALKTNFTYFDQKIWKPQYTSFIYEKKKAHTFNDNVLP